MGGIFGFYNRLGCGLPIDRIRNDSRNSCRCDLPSHGTQHGRRITFFCFDGFGGSQSMHAAIYNTFNLQPSTFNVTWSPDPHCVASEPRLAEKALGGSSRLEALQLALASSHCLMRVFRPIVVPQPLLMRTGDPETPERHGVGAQLVGDPGQRARLGIFTPSGS